jgi:hypothetical protein
LASKKKIKKTCGAITKGGKDMKLNIFLKYLGIWGNSEKIPCPDVTKSIMQQINQTEELENEWRTLVYFGSATTLSAAFSMFITIYQFSYSSGTLERLVLNVVNGGF